MFLLFSYCIWCILSSVNKRIWMDGYNCDKKHECKYKQLTSTSLQSKCFASPDFRWARVLSLNPENHTNREIQATSVTLLLWICWWDNFEDQSKFGQVADIDLCLTVYIRGGSIYQKYRRHIAEIDISVSVSYQHFRYRFSRYINIVSVTSEISVIFLDILSYFFRLFNISLKTDNSMSKNKYLIWQCDTSSHLVTSLLVRNRS